MAQVGKTPNEDGGYDNNDDDNDEDDDDDDNKMMMMTTTMRMTMVAYTRKSRETNEKIPYPDLIILTSHFECWTV